MAILIRFVFMALQLAALTGDIVAVAKCPDPPKYFIGIDTFGGRFKYFTHLTLWINTAYFSIAFLIDLFAAKRLRVYADYLFTTVAWMMSFITVIFFWVLFFMERGLIYPAILEEYIPANGLLNHCWHTLPLVIVLMECALFDHFYPAPSTAMAITFVVSSLYTAWIVYIYIVVGNWIYPFMEKFNPPMFCVFVVFSTIIGGTFHFIGRVLAGSCGRIRTSKAKAA